MDNYQKLKEIINNSNSIVFFTGAGISTPSNIPDFRSSNGLYNEKIGRSTPEQIVSHTFFSNHTEDFFDFYFSKMVYSSALPNKAHYFIANVEKEKKNTFVVTQNIDGLHSFAGSKNVVELHGSVHRNYCYNCGQFFTLDEVKKIGGDVPTCPRCGGIIKPDVVLYEEPLKEEDIEKAIEVISSSDTLVVIGSSLVVYPAASFLRYFKGKHLIVINKQETQYDQFCELVFHEDIISVIDKISKL